MPLSGADAATCPLLALWGDRSIVGTSYDPLRLWREVATDVTGRSLPGGHNLLEELPEQTLSAILECIVRNRFATTSSF